MEQNFPVALIITWFFFFELYRFFRLSFHSFFFYSSYFGLCVFSSSFFQNHNFVSIAISLNSILNGTGKKNNRIESNIQKKNWRNKNKNKSCSSQWPSVQKHRWRVRDHSNVLHYLSLCHFMCTKYIISYHIRRETTIKKMPIKNWKHFKIRTVCVLVSFLFLLL